jgi:hypothetical protein
MWEIITQYVASLNGFIGTIPFLKEAISAVLSALIVAPLTAAYVERNRRSTARTLRLLWLNDVLGRARTSSSNVMQCFIWLTASFNDVELHLETFNKQRKALLEDQKVFAAEEFLNLKTTWIAAIQQIRSHLYEGLRGAENSLTNAIQESSLGRESILLNAHALTARERELTFLLSNLLSQSEKFSAQLLNAVETILTGERAVFQNRAMDFKPILTTSRDLINEFSVPPVKANWLIRLNDWFVAKAVPGFKQNQADISEDQAKSLLSIVDEVQELLDKNAAFFSAEQQKKTQATMPQNAWLKDFDDLLKSSP